LEKEWVRNMGIKGFRGFRGKCRKIGIRDLGVYFTKRTMEPQICS
jgi:hypothetical protein